MSSSSTLYFSIFFVKVYLFIFLIFFYPLLDSCRPPFLNCCEFAQKHIFSHKKQIFIVFKGFNFVNSGPQTPPHGLGKNVEESSGRTSSFAPGKMKRVINYLASNISPSTASRLEKKLSKVVKLDKDIQNFLLK